MAKKKKGNRRLSASDFAKEDAILNEILTGSSKKATLPDANIPSTEPSVDKKPAEETPKSDTKSDQPSDIDTAVSEKADSSSALASGSGAGGVGKCQHVKNTVKLPKLRKDLGHLKDWDHCRGCLQAETKQKKLAQRLESSMTGLSLTDMPESSVEALPSEALWMCLTCCEINCGRAIKEHALQHCDGKTHPLAVNLGTMDCWCYDCDDQIVPSKNRNQVIQECQAIIEKTLQIKQSKMRAASAAISKKTRGSSASSTLVAAPKIKAKVFTSGLTNLGNTCFFNSVVQILTETKSLKDILSEDDTKAAGFPKSLAASTDAGLGPLTINFKKFLYTMWKQQGGTVTPKDLFTQIAKKWKVFRGYREQDSQELMRYLFDGIKQEELDLIKRQLAEDQEVGDDTKQNGKDSSSVEGTDKEQTSDKEEEEENKNDAPTEKEVTAKYVPFIDSCFSGKLVSVIVCDSCKKCSYAPEDFFDLSLPIRGPMATGSTAGSSLKARLLEQSRRASSIVSVDSESSPSTTPPADDKDAIPESEQASEGHLRHVEKLLKSTGQSNSEDLSILRSLNQFTSVDCLDGENKFACENCYKLVRGSQEEYCVSAEKASEETDGDKNENRDEDKDNKADEEKVEDIADAKNADQEVEITKTDDPGQEQEQSNDVPGTEAESGPSSESEGEEQTDRFGNTIPKESITIIAESKKPVKKEEELKYIFRKAFKRYLISSLPPTLVLHLKRFEQSGRFGQMRKIEDHVEIPLELDMAPYFVPRSEIEDEDEDHVHLHRQLEEAKGLSKRYRLYGAVVHMGTLSGGHYMNYVLSSKVQLPETTKTAATMQEKANGSTTQVNGVELPDVPLAEMETQQKGKSTKKKSANKSVNAASLPQQPNNQSSLSADMAVDEKDKEEKKEENTRQWIACSDTSVRLASQEEVLASRAYLLFYERY
ncbi:Ubiquitin carboxyl-terminal hydrolase 16 [Mortierella sp. GBA30]|nr:Ubiquitin carboxyl-terminal hydrolase 16 [Mortierella sp. GBA30]